MDLLEGLRLLGTAATAVQAASSRDQAVEQLLEFFQLQGCNHIWHEIVFDKPRRDKLALIGDAALKYYVVKELVARNVDSSSDLHSRSQTYITNERLGLLQGKVDLFTANGSTLTNKTIATYVEALLGAQ